MTAGDRVEGNRTVNQPSDDEMRRNSGVSPETDEIDRLLRMAAYYRRLGCINVAVSLRALAEAKRMRQAGDFETDTGEGA